MRVVPSLVFSVFVGALSAVHGADASVPARPALDAETAAFFNALKLAPERGGFFWSFDAPWLATKGIPLDETKVAKAAGAIPKMYFAELYYVAGTWRKPEEYRRYKANLSKTVRDAYRRFGSIPVFSWHPENPYASRETICPTNKAFAQPCRYRYAEEGYPQEHRYVIREILDAVEFPRKWYDARLREIAGFLNGLRDSRGRRMPCVVRLFHECEDDWSWWGRGSVKVSDYIEFFRYTVDELRRLTGGGSNLLFLYSPDRYWNAVGEPGKRNYDLLSRYAGDDHVDIIGFDDYTIGKPPTDRQLAAGTNAVAFMEARLAETVRKFRLMSEESVRRGKPCGLVETGGGHGVADDFHTRWLMRALTAEGVRLSFFNTWSGNTLPESPAGLEDFRRFIGNKAVIKSGKARGK